MRRYRRITALLAAILLLVPFCACGKTSETATASATAAVSGNGNDIAAEAPEENDLPETNHVSAELPQITDDRGQTLEITAPKRVAALIGSFADIWCLAGGKDSLAAAANDAWTSFDLNLAEDVINIGSAKDPTAELILASEPDLVLCSSNTQADMDLLPTLEAAGIPTLCFDVENFDDYLRMLKICTELTGCPENYETYGVAVQEVVAEALNLRDDSAPSVLYLRASSGGVKAKGSSGNLLGEMLAELGCRNIADSDDSLLENLSMEAIVQADPDYIFVVLQGTDTEALQRVVEENLLQDPAWQTLTAVREGRYYTLENELYNLKPNARWGEAYEKLAEILYPYA